MHACSLAPQPSVVACCCFHVQLETLKLEPGAVSAEGLKAALSGGWGGGAFVRSTQ